MLYFNSEKIVQIIHFEIKFFSYTFFRSDDEETGDENSTTITSFFSSSNKPSKHLFFKDRNLETVDFL